MFSIIFLGALCFGTTVEALQTITHSDHLDVMHQPVYITILAGIDFLVWCLVFRLIGGYTFHQRTALEAKWLKKNPHLPCPNERGEGENKQDMDSDVEESEENTLQMTDMNPSTEKVTSNAISKGPKSFFDDPRHEPLNLSRDLAPCFLLIITCLIVYLIDQENYPNAPKYVDPVMALITIGFLILSSIPMMKKASLILLQCLPEEWDNVDVLCKDLKNAFSQNITSLHEVHVWCLVPNKIYATLHIIFKDEDSYVSTLSAIHSFLLKYGINHATIQPEFLDNVKNVTPENKETSPATGFKVDTTGNGTHGVSGDNVEETEVSTTDPLRQSACQLPCPQQTCLKKRCCISKENSRDEML
jgi:zinc transporter 1